MIHQKIFYSANGFSTVAIITFMVVFAFVATAVIQANLMTMTTVTRSQSSETAFNIADGGINYYLWHFNHNNADLRDGKTWPATPQLLGYGPYEHDYRNNEGKVIGTYTLWIKPGAVGSTVATVRSIGKTNGPNPAVRTIEAKIGAPSFSTYAVAGNTALWFGNTESASGPVHSNVGVKMDGPNSDMVTSANRTYQIPGSHGWGAYSYKPGVWCDPNIVSPVNCNARLKTSWLYPSPAVDFNKVRADLCVIKKAALNSTATNACTTRPARSASYVPPVYTSYDAETGYLISLNDDNTYNLERVTNERDTRATYTTSLTRSTIATNIPIPENGAIFVEDNVWVRTSGPNGFNGRVTIASARLAVSGETNITIAGPIKYADRYNGNDTIGLIAENNVEVAPYAGKPIEIDAAIIAQSGSVGIRQRYRENGRAAPGYALESQALTFFGSLASNQMWTWSVITCGSETSAACWIGYRYTNNIYDENLRYAPPPFFPVTSTFDIISWREVLTTP